MHRTSGEDFVIESGKHRFIDAAPPTQKGTRLPAEDMNALVEELCYIIEYAGLTVAPDAATDRTDQWKQLYTAIFTSQKISGVDALVAGSIAADRIRIRGVSGNAGISGAMIALATITNQLLSNECITRNNIAGYVSGLYGSNNLMSPFAKDVFNNGTSLPAPSTKVAELALDQTFKFYKVKLHLTVVAGDALSFSFACEVFNNLGTQLFAIAPSFLEPEFGTGVPFVMEEIIETSTSWETVDVKITSATNWNSNNFISGSNSYLQVEGLPLHMRY